MAIKTKFMILFLNPGMKTPAISSEADTEQVFILGWVSEQETSLRFVLQQCLSLVPVHLAPVETAVSDLCQVGNQVMVIVNLVNWELDNKWKYVMGVIFLPECEVWMNSELPYQHKFWPPPHPPLQWSEMCWEQVSGHQCLCRVDLPFVMCYQSVCN